MSERSIPSETGYARDIHKDTAKEMCLLLLLPQEKLAAQCINVINITPFPLLPLVLLIN